MARKNRDLSKRAGKQCPIRSIPNDRVHQKRTFKLHENGKIDGQLTAEAV